ncbi:copper amine oxidase N-terminal domain-containing protein [Anoxynatronum buryatiense]|uniref:copper amine oxidase N-terminal domain-containing protein n=1 Tax=Anoxynatronum buryatiense TaxID=489973 RepID=UPI0024B6F597|nr:copper amine oxidase N-terminal domain-containing protein [Anoxynatronum buryatiense]
MDNSNRTLVPVRVVSENLGMAITWDEGAQRVGINNEMFLTIGSATAMVRGASVTMDTRALIVGGRTYVPLRFVSENFGVGVDWAHNNLGGIDVFLYTDPDSLPVTGPEPTPELEPEPQPQPGNDYSALDAGLPKNKDDIIHQVWGFTTIKDEVVDAYLNAASSTIKLTGNTIEMYLPQMPVGCGWDVRTSALLKGEVIERNDRYINSVGGEVVSFSVNWSTQEDYSISIGLDRDMEPWCISNMSNLSYIYSDGRIETSYRQR